MAQFSYFSNWLNVFAKLLLNTSILEKPKALAEIARYNYLRFQSRKLNLKAGMKELPLQIIHVVVEGTVFTPKTLADTKCKQMSA